MNTWEPSHCYFYQPHAVNTDEKDYLPEEYPQFPVDVVIICAVDIEYETLLEHLFGLGQNQWENISVPNDGKWRAISINIPNSSATLRIACGKTRGMGIAAAATKTSAAIHAFKPRFLIMAGITAGRLGKTRFGDIIVADPVWDYGEGRWEDQGGKMVFKGRPKQRSIDPEIFDWVEHARVPNEFGAKVLENWLNLDRDNKPFERPQVRIGSAVSGAAVVDSLNFWQDLITDEKILGLDMEAYGFAFAAHNSASPKYTKKWLVAKSVCDFGVEKNKTAQRFAAFCSTKFVEKFLSEFVMIDDLKNSPSESNVI